MVQLSQQNANMRGAGNTYACSNQRKDNFRMASSDSTTKRCGNCGQTYPRTAEFFNRSRRIPDGLSYTCRVCTKAANAAYHATHPRRQHPKRETVITHIDSKTMGMSLPNGEKTLIDVRDVDLTNSLWAIGANGYVHNSSRTQRDYLHRIIMSKILDRQLGKSEFVDHINGNRIDNRRSNLRLCTSAENLRNTGVHPKSTTGYKGVKWDNKRGVWYSSISIKGKTKYLGSYTNPVDAARAYDNAAIEASGEFAKTNAMLGLIPAEEK
jgi:hypothetical protein